VELETESNAADPKYPISSLSKFVVGKMEKTWLTNEIENEEGRETDRVLFLFGHWYNKSKIHFLSSKKIETKI
jgi:hypothetical protein